MRHVEVLGFECAACRKTFALINETARTMGLAVDMVKVDDPARFAAYRILDAPAIAVEGLVVYSGGIPPRWQIEVWLTTPLFKERSA